MQGLNRHKKSLFFTFYVVYGIQSGRDEILICLCIDLSSFQALDGFVIVLTRDFEVFYASETVQDYLGLAQVNNNTNTVS